MVIGAIRKAIEKRRQKKTEETKVPKVQQTSPPVQKKQGLPAFEKVIDGFEEIPGLFTLYWNKEKNKIVK